jgi:hypothetical protein
VENAMGRQIVPIPHGSGAVGTGPIESGRERRGTAEALLDITLTEQGMFAVWEETIVGIYIYGARYNGSKNQWNPENLVRQRSTMPELRVAADNAGNAIAVWQQEYSRIYASRYSAGDWTVPVPRCQPETDGNH